MRRFVCPFLLLLRSPVIVHKHNASRSTSLEHGRNLGVGCGRDSGRAKPSGNERCLVNIQFAERFLRWLRLEGRSLRRFLIVGAEEQRAVLSRGRSNSAHCFCEIAECCGGLGVFLVGWRANKGRVGDESGEWWWLGNLALLG